MRIQGWKSTAVVAGAAALMAAGPGPAVAAVPKGETIASGLHEPVLYDAARQQVVDAMTPTGVRTIDVRSGATRDVDVAGRCAVAAGAAALTAVGDGYALLHCDVPCEGRSPAVRAEPRVLDLSSGELIVPAGLSAVWDHSSPRFVGVSDTTLSFDVTAHRQGTASYELDWRTGAIARSTARPLVCATGGVRWATTVAGLMEAVGCAGHGRVAVHRRLRTGEQSFGGRSEGGLLPWVVGTAAGARQYVYAHDCRMRLGWDVATSTTGWIGGGALLLKSVDGGSSTLRRVPLAGVCDRTARPWTVRLASAGRTVRLQPATAHVSDVVTGAEGTLLQPLVTRPTTVRATKAGRLAVFAAPEAISLRWRSGGSGGWKRAADRGRRWTLRLPRGARTLKLDLRLRDGSRASYDVRLRRAAR
jgi:hypothetical protein